MMSTCSSAPRSCTPTYAHHHTVCRVGCTGASTGRLRSSPSGCSAAPPGSPPRTRPCADARYQVQVCAFLSQHLRRWPTSVRRGPDVDNLAKHHAGHLELGYRAVLGPKGSHRWEPDRPSRSSPRPGRHEIPIPSCSMNCRFDGSEAVTTSFRHGDLWGGGPEEQRAMDART